jgi:hypothetical protein
MKFINQTTIPNVVTRQTLYDSFANAAISTIESTDLAAGTLALDKGSGASAAAPNPGAIFFDKTEQLYKLWVDEVDNTGVSLWLSVMGDRRDDAFLSDRPIPPYAAFAPSSEGGRYVRTPDSTTIRWEIYGFNLKGETIPSGTWFAGGVMGYMTACYAIDSSYSHASDPQESSLEVGERGILLPCHPDRMAAGQVIPVSSANMDSYDNRYIGYYLGGQQGDLLANATHYTSYPFLYMPIWKTEVRNSTKFEV